MSDFLLTSSGAVIDFRPMAKGSWALVYSHGSWIPWVGVPGDLSGSRALSEIEAIKLTSPETWLTERSKAAFDLLVTKVHEAGVVTSAFDSYGYYLKAYGQKRGLKPKRISRSDTDRLLFEILCFAAFQIVVRAFPAYLKGKYGADSELTVGPSVRLFSQKLLDSLENFLDAHKIAPAEDNVITKGRRHGRDGPVERHHSAGRMSDYLAAGSIEEELRIFSSHAGCAIDPLNTEVTEIIALSHTGIILDVVSRTLSAVFEE